jgi:transcriptional regulator
MVEDPIKSAFQKVKQDINDLKQQIEELKRTSNETDRQTDKPTNQTDRHIIQTYNHSEKTPEPQDLPISTGNEGVQTDRQTNQQTDRQITEVRLSPFVTRGTRTRANWSEIVEPQISNAEDSLAKIEKLSETLISLDSIKKDLRIKFKKLTDQEMLVFSTIYQLEEQGLAVNYSSLASKTNLSESSIRDYVQKLIKKGVPVDKTKENNKKVSLSVHPNLKKIASLSTILQLREI